MIRTLPLALLAVVCLALPAAAQPGNTPSNKRESSSIEKRVQLHLDRGIEFYAERQFELAIIEFRAGFALDPRPDFLFALAQAERLSGDCATAVVYYRRFLQTKPEVNQAEAAGVNMKRCVRALESGPGGKQLARPSDALSAAEKSGGAPPPLTPLANSRPAIDSERSSAPRKPWYRDVLGTGLLVSGVIGVGVGSGFFVASSSTQSDARAATDAVEYEDLISRARSQRTVSIAALSIGSALIGGAIIRYVTRGSTEERTRLTAAPTANGGGSVVLLGSF